MKNLIESLRLAATFHDLEQPPRNSDGDTMREAAAMLEQYAATIDILEQTRRELLALRQRPTPERPPHQREGGIAKAPTVFTHGLTLTAADIEEIAGTGPAVVCPSITQELREAMKIVNEQAENEGLWFEAEYITESVLQAALRRLHAALEAAAKGETCTQVASYAGEKPA